jgi:CRP-like cAMP-binding protein
MSEINKSPAFWRSFPIFEEFDKETISAIAALATYRKWTPGTVIFQRGDEGNYMIAVLSGRIKLSLITPQGRELLLRHIEAGALFGEMAILDNQPRSADATAITATEGYVIGKKAFLDFITHTPNAAESIIRYLCSQLRDTTDRLETIALYDLHARVARFFLATLKQIHGTELPESANLRLTLSQSDIAGILGASRPKVNRAILALEECSAIKRADGVITCHIGRLQRIAEPEEE